MFYEPINFKEAEKAFKKRKQTPTYFSFEEIARNWNAEARARAFFSARVTSATILSEIHSKVQAVVEGKATKGQARAILQRYFVGNGANAISAMGFAPADEAVGTAQLASSQRLNLIIETNVRMANECGRYKQWERQKEIYQYGVWKCGYAKEHRIEHLARDGKAYAFDHPIWTQSPPGGEFNCNCTRLLMRAEDLKRRGITPEELDSKFQPSTLDFDPSKDFAKPPKFGKRVKPEYKEKAQQQIDDYMLEMEQNNFKPEINITNKKLAEAVEIAQEIVAENLGQLPPFKSVHRLMTTGEEEQQKRNLKTRVAGFQSFSIDKGRKEVCNIAISRKTACPILVDIHETIHACINNKCFNEKDLENLYNKLKKTESFTEISKNVNNQYEKTKVENEILTRAIAWAWFVNSNNNSAIMEKFAIIKNRKYNKGIIWDELDRRKYFNNEHEEAQEAIMALRKKTIFQRIKKKLGFTDKGEYTLPPEEIKKLDEEFKEYNLTGEEILEICNAFGETVEEFRKEFNTPPPDDIPWIM